MKNQKMIIVKGKPKGKGRPRFSTKGKFVSVYTDKATTDYEDKIVKEWVKKYGMKNGYGEKPVAIYIKAYMTIPSNTSKIKKEKMIKKQEFPTKRPDIDNICKIVLDALNGVAYKDDKSVIKIIAEKLYGEEPRIEIYIGEI